jgi:hypothetical protein
MKRRSNGNNFEAAPKKRMCRIGHLDDGYFFFFWVIEGGIKLKGRLTLYARESL